MMCERMDTVVLKTVYRTSDEEHLIFPNGIRERQPTRGKLEEYFEERFWKDRDCELGACVAASMSLAEQEGHPFVWLTCASPGAAKVCEAALVQAGISHAGLESIYPCDPASESSPRIVARPGLVVRLTLNLDKKRGFVNGAMAAIEESLEGNSVFTARLAGTGNLVFVHPIYEGGQIFLPCCYGYATTIRLNFSFRIWDQWAGGCGGPGG